MTTPYLVLKNGKTERTVKAPAEADGVLLTWPEATCYQSATDVSDRYPPIASVVMQQGLVCPAFPPQIAPCSTGLQLTWNQDHHLTKAQYRDNASPNEYISYLHRQPVDGFHMVFQADTLESAAWTKAGEKLKDISLLPGTNNVLWSSYKGIPQLTKPSGLSVTFFARHFKSEQSVKVFPPADANGIDLGWYLNNLQPHGPTRGCIVADGIGWTTPAMSYVFTKGGALHGPIRVLRCPLDSSGEPIHFNDLDFQWDDSGLIRVVPQLEGKPAPGISVDRIPQPPLGTDGFIFGFHLDNFKGAAWTRDGAVVEPIDKLMFSKMAIWQGG